MLAPGFALAQEAGGSQPRPWEMSLQPAATPVAENIHSFHNGLLVVITLISLLVLSLLVYVMMRFNARSNPVASRTTHNTMIEVVWTIVPVLILIGIAIPSFKLLYFQRVIPKADMTIKAVGNQWYWSYEYPDLGQVAFDAYMVPEKELKEGQPRLLATDKDVVVPVGKTIHLLTTANDVIHSWAMPSFGVKIDAIPGRINDDWFRVEREGIYYGQCSELCGKDHAFMPIAVRAVSEADFKTWSDTAKSAGIDEANKKLAEILATKSKVAGN
ncbi:MAG: cytochrome c oxidase subunit II [Hyphomicrobiales bacterium]